jgi:hypothetical protein
MALIDKEFLFLFLHYPGTWLHRFHAHNLLAFDNCNRFTFLSSEAYGWKPTVDPFCSLSAFRTNSHCPTSGWLESRASYRCDPPGSPTIYSLALLERNYSDVLPSPARYGRTVKYVDGPLETCRSWLESKGTGNPFKPLYLLQCSGRLRILEEVREPDIVVATDYICCLTHLALPASYSNTRSHVRGAER